MLEMPHVDAQHLLHTAQALTSTLSELSSNWLAERIHYLSGFPNPAKAYEHTNFKKTAAMMITTWEHLGADHVRGIPGTSENSKASALRKPSYKSGGGMRMLARRAEKDAGYKVLVCLEEREMGRLVEGLVRGRMLGRVLDG
jgi:hypothetical protein